MTVSRMRRTVTPSRQLRTHTLTTNTEILSLFIVTYSYLGNTLPGTGPEVNNKLGGIRDSPYYNHETQGPMITDELRYRISETS